MPFWRRQPILRGYVSELDRLLQDFALKPEATSVSRLAEEAKYRWINTCRDDAQAKQPTIQIWEDFQNEGN